MRRIINISYRLPFSFVKTDSGVDVRQSAGGLVSAVLQMGPAAGGGKNLWVGCADFSKEEWGLFKSSEDDNFDYLPVFLPKKTNADFYYGFSNSVIWPLFHYFPSFVEYSEKQFGEYRRANEIVCEKIVEVLRDDDIIWVHDYHFFMLPDLLRKKGVQNRIGFFLHIPFPSYELFRVLPKNCKELLLKGILGADLVGFHANDYALHFIRSVKMLLGYQHTLWQIECPDNRVCKIDVFPISTDFKKFNSAYDDPGVVQIRENEIRNVYKNRKVIFSVDRLDYTKGVLYRLKSFEYFLKQYPQWHEKVVFIMVVVPSRDAIQKYWERRKDIEHTVSRINGLYSKLTWQPINYKYGSLSFEELCALYTACNVALITPIRDGMNLVAKEFIASRKDEQGVLILSETAGASHELGEAVLINPIDTVECADKIDFALNIPPDEQRRRMRDMQYLLRDNDINKWRDNFLGELTNVDGDITKAVTTSLTPEKMNAILAQFTGAAKRL
ncbi:MAG TPA: trehalose-6-phosphate synthase, partial [Chitinophagales bacterium]|nr:trehalose-6-phosphate synthase [Chitinophagales bacterium]